MAGLRETVKQNLSKRNPKLRESASTGFGVDIPVTLHKASVGLVGAA